MIDPSYAHAVSAAILLVVVWAVAYVAYMIGTQQKTKGMIETYKERFVRTAVSIEKKLRRQAERN